MGLTFVAGVTEALEKFEEAVRVHERCRGDAISTELLNEARCVMLELLSQIN